MLELKVDRRADPDGRRLRELLDAVTRVEKLSAERQVVVHLLIPFALILWIDAAWPGTLPTSTHRLALAAFACILVAAVIIGAVEARWTRIRARRLREHGHTALDDEAS